MTQAPKLPLAGLKIVELGHYIAAPFATRLLADLGAEVIKVEPPGGDPVRGWGSSVDGNAVWFSVHGRNKLSVTLDLKKPEDRARLVALLKRADALVENFRAGYLERIGLGPDVLHAENPRLIIGRISGYGQDGPYRDKPAFGAIGEAMGGLRHLTANPGQTDFPPPRCGFHRRPGGDVLRHGGGRCVLGSEGQSGSAGAWWMVGVQRVLADGRMLPEYGLFGWVRQPQGTAIKTAAPTNTILRGWEVAVHRRGRTDLQAADGGDQQARMAADRASPPMPGAARRWANSTPSSPTGRGRRPGRRPSHPGSRRGAVFAAVRHGRLRQ